MSFLPITKEEMTARGWEAADFVYVTGDAYVDHPSFGPAIIGRVLEAEGYRETASREIAARLASGTPMTMGMSPNTSRTRLE